MSAPLHLLCLAALDLSAGSTLRPFIPLIAENMGASTLEIGFISSVHAIFQIISAPIIGSLSDNIGRKQLLQFSFLASALTPLLIFLMNTFEYSYHFLFLSVIPMAIFRHSQACIKSIIIDQSMNDTLNAMAQWSCACYIGTTFGPLLITLITDKESVNIICIISVTLFLFAFVLTVIFMTDIDNNNNNKGFKLKSKKLSLNIFRITFPNEQIKKLIFYHFIAYFALNLYRAGFILILKHRFELEMNALAKVLSYKGIIGFGMQLYLSQYKQKKNGNSGSNEYALLWKSTLCLSVSMILYGFISEVYHLYIVLILQECGESMFRTSFQAVFAHNVAKLSSNSTQTCIGLVDSLASLNRSITPIIFGLIPQQFRYFLTPVIAGCLDLFLFLTQTPAKLKSL